MGATSGLNASAEPDARRIRLRSHRAATWLAVLGLLLLGSCIHRPPGRGWRGPLPPLTEQQQALSAQLRGGVQHLAGGIGVRALGEDPDKLFEARRWIERELERLDYRIERQEYEVEGHRVANLAVEVRGFSRPDQIVIIGAHYDTVPGSPGANDNASGVAAVLALAEHFRSRPTDRTLRLLFFVNEECPYCQTPLMGSYQYARAARERGDDITAMIALDLIGYYSQQRRSQRYPFPLSLLYPSRGNFIAIVTNRDNRRLMNTTVAAFRRHAQFPSEGLAMQIHAVGRSDHWGFWQFGYPAVLFTDTAEFRYPHYHQPTDTPEKLDYESMARVTTGLAGMLEELTRVE